METINVVSSLVKPPSAHSYLLSSKMYKIGGCVRDALLGVPSKDIDYVCICSSYEEMRQDILSRGTIFLEKPEYLTIRAKIGKEAADFVMARKDGAYYDGRRPDTVEPGTLLDDQSRRDFTCNSIAQDSDGTYIDPFNGVADIEAKLIRCVGNTADRLGEDALRMLRAIRFSITKGFEVDAEIRDYICGNGDKISQVSEDRIRDEIGKCFAANTLKTLEALEFYDVLKKHIFSHTNIWLQPTSRAK